MKTRFPIIAALLTAALAIPALAEEPRRDVDAPRGNLMPMEQALRKLSDAGYGDLKGLNSDDGYWEGTVSRNGTSMEVRIDPATGAVTTMNESDQDGGNAD